ncbi:MAG: hypothetical protein JNM88_06890 [Chitinophagaceae bacterium]|nr:hypothetical protein [Chitinophagaceae bacterium]
MAITKQELLLRGLRGAIGKEVVIKQYSYGTVVTAFPVKPLRKRKPSPIQSIRQGVFKEAVKYAKSIVHDQKKKAAYAKKLKKGQQVYHAAIREYMGKHLKVGGKG